MVKQFTIPCQFQGGQTSPVTLYIGHPEFTHHPVQFQSDWLSSTKGGTIPQDLMDTLQKLHDLANENGADFEELCYYALISATQHGSGSGVSQDDIHKYADEYIKQEGNVNMNNQQEQQTTQTEEGGAGGFSANSNNEKDNNSSGNGNTSQGTNFKEAEKVVSEKDNSSQNTSQNTGHPVAPTINANQNSGSPYGGDEDLMEDALLNDTDVSGSSNAVVSYSSNNEDSAYSAEDEDLLLADED